jgi:tungstate transport system substrate-binding protein
VGLLAAASASTASADTIRVQSTTDTVDAGLVDGLLKPAYQAAQPGDTLSYVGVGTGAALANAQRGLADVVITHAPSLERQFTANGFSLEPEGGRAIFSSDYVIVGPASDPAGVGSGAPHDAISAFEKIAAAGAAGRASFVSRGDNSGTNVQEEVMWGDTGVTPKQPASNGAGDATRSEPGSGGTSPSWYVKTGAGQAASLLRADACAAAEFPDGSCYTIVDRGTYDNQLNRGTIANLRILSQDNAANARGGADLLVNPFSAYIVSPAKVPGVNVAAARRFIDFLVSPRFQASVDTFPTATDPAFHADAYPSVRLARSLSPSLSADATLPLTVTLANKVPGSPIVVGMPVTLQSSTNSGRSWKTVVANRKTDSRGVVRFSPKVKTTTSYRLSLPRFRATDWNQFSPNTQDLGTVAVAPPAVTKATLKPRALLVTVSAPATIRATVSKRTVTTVRRGGRARKAVTWTKVRSASKAAGRRGRVELKWKRALAPGAYRAELRLNDRFGHSRRQTVSLSLKAGKAAAR